jgi:hypothetical protein
MPRQQYTPERLAKSAEAAEDAANKEFKDPVKITCRFLGMYMHDICVSSSHMHVHGLAVP